MAKTCRDCGSQSRDVDRFCAACGTTLAGVPVSTVKPTGFCTACGAPLAAADRFCGRCGQPTVPDDRDRTQPHLVSGGGFFEGWDREPPTPAEEPRTESIPVPAKRRSDTAVLPVQSDPYLKPASPADRPVEVLEPPEPEAGPARPAPPPRAERPAGAFPWGASLALLGAVAIVVSALLPWTRGELVLVPRDLPFRFLISPEAADAGRVAGPSLGIVLLVAGVAGALVALLTMVAPFLRFLRRLIGLLTLVVPVLFVIRLATAGGVGLDALPDALGVGVYVAAAGSAVQIVAGRWFRR